MTEIDGEYHNMQDVEVLNMEFDSRRVTPGTLYIALTGERFDGHDFIAEALQKGAVALLTQRCIDSHAPQIVVRDTRSIMGVVGRRFYSGVQELDTVGITGTNGKTTTAFMIHNILGEAGQKPGMIGTIYYMIGDERINAVRTTPESLDVFKMMEAWYEKGARAVVMEVSSHALSLKRVDELRFRTAVFTNISQDHLDFHGTMDEYKRAKLHLFDLLMHDGIAVYNVDDAVSQDIRERSLPGCISFGMNEPADVQATVLCDTMDGIAVDIEYQGNRYRMQSELVGTYNAYNIAAAFAAGVALDIDVESIRKGILLLKKIPGRMERVVDNIFVDYAHTPSALEHALRSLRSYTKGRLFVVFGCGGDRDKGKRPIMGTIASRLSDIAVITNDNPRSEAPERIIEDILGSTDREKFTVIPDRRKAIAYAIRQKRPDDVVLVAGKGHENYQIIGDRIVTFDDTEAIRTCFENS
ncbi:MAG: UDP-N-acetylmuramoyl-L-alanyl-D-glutamate--2,6-diaminopimelate ligase [candidate division WOR-3 bacterium]|nr:MAG: UDP-N-acetylmuramoyl-L-alanyl-D-glutamate--2,6-diaminopimelate ligase [candidate division WOR-3 bacterium]